MSFRDFDVDLEDQKPFSDLPEFDHAAEEASNVLLDLNNNLVSLSKFIKNLKLKSKFNNNLNDKIVHLIEKITEIFKGLSLLNKKLIDFQDEDLNPSQLFIKEKILREIKTSLDEFTNLQSSFKEFTNNLNEEAKTVLNEEISSSIHDQEQSSQLILEEDLINNDEFLYQQNLIREREEEIQNIEQGVQELNEIFNDLGQIVQEQGQMVDNIETNIYDVSNSTKTASNELKKALNYQKRSKKTTLCLFTVLLVILLVVLLSIFL